MPPASHTVSLDYHGILDRHPERNQPAMERARRDGVRLVVLTLAPVDFVRPRLEAAGYQEGVHYDGIVSVIDNLAATVPMHRDERGRLHPVDPAQQWRAKGALCADLGIDDHVDDKAGYAAGFAATPTRFHLHAQGCHSCTRDRGDPCWSHTLGLH